MWRQNLTFSHTIPADETRGRGFASNVEFVITPHRCMLIEQDGVQRAAWFTL